MLIAVQCPGCKASYRIDTEKIPPGGGHLTCPSCGRRWVVKAEQLPSEASPADSSPTVAVSANTTATGRSRPITCPSCGHHFFAGDGDGKPRKLVLVVDDQEFFRNFAVDLLSDRYDTHVAKSTEEAMRKAEELKPALIILDLGLEGGADDGKRVLEALRGTVPVIIMTGRNDFDAFGEDWRVLEALGARNLVIKSMSIGEELRSKVAALIGN